MTEWLILLLLVPAIVVPVVLLVGFAGCDVVYGLERPTATITAAEGTSGSAITLTWTKDTDDDVEAFEFDRMKLPERSRDTVRVVPGSKRSYVDNDEGEGLMAETTYLYRIRPILSGGVEGTWSADEPDVSGTTFPFETTFAWTAEEQARSRDAAGWQGACLIQRIEASRLSTSGTQIRLTLRASSVGNVLIERIYISRPDPAPGADPYDSDGDPTVYTSTIQLVPANTSKRFDPIKFNLAEDQPLLIAVDFNVASASEIRTVDDPVGASAYFKTGASGEAANRDRTGFTEVPRSNLIEKIEVA